MSNANFDPNCKGCRPTMIDAKTKKPLPDDHPYMVKVFALWNEQPLDVKEAWHRVTCLNSTAPADRKKAMDFVGLLVRAVAN